MEYRKTWNTLFCVAIIVQAWFDMASAQMAMPTCADQLQECAAKTGDLERDLRRSMDAVFTQCTAAEGQENANQQCRSDWTKYQNCMSQILFISTNSPRTLQETLGRKVSNLESSLEEAMRIYKAEIDLCIKPSSRDRWADQTNAENQRSATFSHADAFEAAVFDWSYGDDFWGFRIPAANFECGFTFGKINLFGNGPITSRVESLFKSNCRLSERQFRCILDRIQTDFRVAQTSDRLTGLRSGCVQNVLLQTRCQPVLTSAQLSACLCAARDRFERRLEKFLLDCMTLEAGVPTVPFSQGDAATGVSGKQDTAISRHQCTVCAPVCCCKRAASRC